MLKMLHETRTPYQKKLNKILSKCRKCGDCCKGDPLAERPLEVASYGGINYLENKLSDKLKSLGLVTKETCNCTYLNNGLSGDSCIIYDLRSPVCRGHLCSKIRDDKRFNEQLLARGSVNPISENNLIKFLRNWYKYFEDRGIAVLTDDVNRIGDKIAETLNIPKKQYEPCDEEKFKGYVLIDNNESLVNLIGFSISSLEMKKSIIVSNTKLDNLGNLIDKMTTWPRLHSFIIVE